ncbi:excisionase family DNA binding protein [Rhizobium sp. BK313]|uniref:hypothetical protein n=1 Tax=Rhizobium sp. BK313 TaxID=2587081 RepID=UPI0010EF52F4|nr:hypothetical protein [Rhizobium sp. BK313]MBB3455208.1 excisionase family DNA binding protein [Rhizobium sp. BK313]
MNNDEQEVAQPQRPNKRGAMTIKGFRAWSGVGLSKVYEEIGAGRLPAHKLGRKTLIFVADAEEWLAALPSGLGPPVLKRPDVNPQSEPIGLEPPVPRLSKQTDPHPAFEPVGPSGMGPAPVSNRAQKRTLRSQPAARIRAWDR